MEQSESQERVEKNLQVSTEAPVKKRPGRKPGVPNKNMRDVREIIDNVVDFDKVFASLLQLATHPRRPDTFAARLLLEYRYGKPFQAVGLAIKHDEQPRIAIVQNGEEINLIASGPVQEPIDISHTEETIIPLTNETESTAEQSEGKSE